MLPESYWRGPLAAIALGFVVTCSFAWIAWHVSADLTEERVRGEKTAEYHDQYAEDAIDEECLALEMPALRDCIHQQIEAARDHERAEQDLDAQQAMARFTRVMGWTAIAGLVLGGVSILVIYYTLREMQRTNTIMRTQQRAWISVEDITIRRIHGFRPASGEEAWIFVEGTRTVRNNGHTATKALINTQAVHDPNFIDRVAEIRNGTLKSWKKGSGIWIAPNCDSTSEYTLVFKVIAPNHGDDLSTEWNGVDMAICVSVAYSNGVDHSVAQTYRIGMVLPETDRYGATGRQAVLDLDTVFNGTITPVVYLGGHGEMT